MSGINKYSFPSWILVTLGLAIGGSAQAGQVTDSFTAGNPLTAAQMTGIKNAVNDNNTRLGTAETNITNLQGGVPSTTCAGNPAVTGDTMVRVGPLCVDQFRARVTSKAGCDTGGITGCGSIRAESTSGGTADSTLTWAQAVRACANAGKRLLTPGEWMAAVVRAAFSDNTIDTYEWADATYTSSSADIDITSLMQVGYIGNNTANPAGISLTINANIDSTGLGVFFRCAR
jgi:hypothetical protein